MNANVTTETVFARDREDFERLGQQAMAIIGEYLRNLPDTHVDPVVPEDQRQLLSTLKMPEQGMTPEEVLEFLAKQVMPWPQPIGHQRSYAWVNTPPLPISILADALAQTMNCSLDGYDFSGIFLMVSLSRWFMELTGFPADGAEDEEAMAILLSGGTAANLNALTTARYWAAKEDGWNVREEGFQGAHPTMIAYASDQVHSSVQRCAEQLGLGANNLRNVPTDANFRLDVNALKRMVAEDKAAGHRPFAVVASAGTTNVGAIDPFNAIADVCEAEGLWFHVDGAYGGIGGLDPAYAEAYEGLGRADTLTTDPHKWLHVPVDCGALLTRRKSLHREAYTLTPDYLEESDQHGAPWPYEYILQLTYANRGIKTWAAIARLGRDGVRDLVIRCNRLAAYLDNLVGEAPDLERLAPQSLSVVNFRYVPQGGDLSDEALDTLNTRISDAISESGEAHMPTTKVNGRISLRACVLHIDNNEEDMRHLVALVQRLGAEQSDDLSP